MSKATVMELAPPEKLQACPFCGDVAKLYVHELDGVPELEASYRVECTGCGGCGPGYDDIFKSTRYWNQACSSFRERLEVANEALDEMTRLAMDAGLLEDD